ncbi:hypothetical protein GGR57DRAFT_461240 [Xylariaceae sp. FL1272]|nr:hypothetical protein GGR57DRAFT_461240 [Xylariaceae sp. FL1272]
MHWINILTEGAVYFQSRGSNGDDDDHVLQQYSRGLLGKPIDSTFDTVYCRVDRRWHLQDDIVDPFHDRRGAHIQTVWIFDLDNDILRLDKKNYRLQLPLYVLRSRAATIADFHSYAPPWLAEPRSQPFLLPPYWKLRCGVLDLDRIERRRPLFGRILADFAFEWRHMLCSRYNDSTFRKFASAIIKIATLDFNVVEVDVTRQDPRDFLVLINNLPEWDPFKERIIPLSGISVVLSRNMPHAITMLKNDWAKRPSRWAPDSRYYLILTVREVILCRINRDSAIYTKPERLFNGYDPPSEEAMQMLLEATYVSFSKTAIHLLPVELQDHILDNVSAWPVERARVSCILGIGSIFRWRWKNRDIKSAELFRYSSPLPESHICFGNQLSGVAYR